jgi:hypothetical protein
MFPGRNVAASALVGGTFCEVVTEHNAINGQTLSQSEAGALSGQHAISSGMPAADAPASTSAPTAAGMSVGIAMAGRASGATSIPATARAWKRAPMYETNLTEAEYHTSSLRGNGAPFTVA